MFFNYFLIYELNIIFLFMKDQLRDDLYLSCDSGPETDQETLKPDPTPRAERKRAILKRLLDRQYGGVSAARKLLLAEK